MIVDLEMKEVVEIVFKFKKGFEGNVAVKKSELFLL